MGNAELARRQLGKLVGAAARLGGILEVPFPRPRNRAAVLEHPDDYSLRERLIQFLEEEAAPRVAAA
jgi:hypothetical protein